MNFMKRAFLYVSRKRGKSILLFFILLILSTFVLTGLSIGSASKQAQKNLRQNIGGSFNIDVNYSDSNPYYHEEESENEDGSSDLLMYSTEQVTSKMVENIRNISGVKFCDATTESLINFDKLLPFAGTVPLDESLSHCVKSIGVWRSEEQNFFTSGKIQLIEGRHILDNDIHKVILCKDLAEKNNLNLGDSLIVTNENGKQLSFEIIGLFHAQKLEKVGESIPTYDKIQNLIFTDIESIVELENSVAVQGFDTVKVTVNDPKDIEKIIEQVKHFPDYEENVYNITFSFELGKVYAILGSSGSGKTTLLSLLGGLDIPTTGTILYENEDIKKIGLESHRQNHVSLIFQNYNLIDYMTPIENATLATKKDVDVVPLLKRLGLSDKELKRTILKLSGGQQQRVAIARSLATDVPIILADEPTGNLDEITAAEITQILQETAHKLNKCVIIVTHSKDVAQKADAVLELKQGILRQVKK